MHGSIRDGLEALLGEDQSKVDEGTLARAGEHLSSCAECTAEFGIIRAQAAMLRTLKTQEDVEPAAGFYARVMQRIEERNDSVWSVFLSPLGTRLAYASLTLAVVLGSYVVAHESRDGHLGGESMMAQSSHYDAPVIGDQSQQRDAVLENFASH